MTLAQRASSLRETTAAEISLLAALALGSIWPVVVAFEGRVTIGRLLLALCTVTVAADVLRRGWRIPRRPLRPLLFLGSLAALVGWATMSAATWGCFCFGGAGGLAETASVASLAMIVALRNPTRRGLPLWAAAVGVAAGAVFAAAGFRIPGSALEGEGSSGRLEGVYGNPNALAYAVAFIVPLLVVRVARANGRERGLWLALTFAAAGILVLTFSRGGLIAAAGGSLAAAVLAVPARRRRFLLTTASILIAVGAVSYPYLTEARREAEIRNKLAPFASNKADLQARDRSGWDGSAQGLIRFGHARMGNVGAALRARTSRAGQGVSYEWGDASPLRTYALRASVRADSSTILKVGLEDNLQRNGPTQKAFMLTPRWATVEVRWTPSVRSSAARAYFWTDSAPATFFIRDVEIHILGPHPAATRVPIETRLAGSEWEQLRADIGDPEAEYLSSRREALRLSFRAIVDHPLAGLGWERFPSYASTRSSFGPLSTHNEYLRFASELGVVAIFLLSLIGSLVLMGLLSERSPLRVEWAGVLVTGAVGLLFFNGLVVTAASLPLAVAAGLAAAAPPRQRAP